MSGHRKGRLRAAVALAKDEQRDRGQAEEDEIDALDVVEDLVVATRERDDDGGRPCATTATTGTCADG